MGGYLDILLIYLTGSKTLLLGCKEGVAVTFEHFETVVSTFVVMSHLKKCSSSGCHTQARPWGPSVGHKPSLHEMLNKLSIYLGDVEAYEAACSPNQLSRYGILTLIMSCLFSF